MSEPDLADLPPPWDGGASPLVLLEALRQAQHFDPVRFHYLEVLSQRLPAQPEGVRHILESKWRAALADYGERFMQAQHVASDGRSKNTRRTGASAVPTAAGAPLPQLNQYIRHARAKGLKATHGGLDGDAQTPAEMTSVSRFRETWSRHRAAVQVEQAVGRAPENSGPFNSHSLVLQTLALVRDLSPDYLRRFLSQVETLQWLEQASETYPKKKAKPAKARQARRNRTAAP